MTSYVQDGTVGSWAAEKLVCLEKYLSAYTTILRRQSDWCEGYFYVDAFAGAGRAKLRDTDDKKQPDTQLLFDISKTTANDDDKNQYIDGSPRVALGIKHPFTHYYFIEKDTERIAQLLDLQKEFSKTHRISVREGDANVELAKLVDEFGIKWRFHRAVVLLDPFGMQVPWETIETLAETDAIEVLVNLPVGMAIQRLLPQSGRISQKQKNMLTRYLGSPEWENVIYEKTSDLFEDELITKAEKSGERLAKWYQRRLTNVFGFGAKPRLVRNSQGGHLYYLLFAGPNENGAKIAKDVLDQGETVR